MGFLSNKSKCIGKYLNWIFKNKNKLKIEEWRDDSLILCQYFEKTQLPGFFFDSNKHLQTYIDSVNQCGNSVSICMTKDDWIRTRRAKLSAFVFSI